MVGLPILFLQWVGLPYNSVELSKNHGENHCYACAQINGHVCAQMNGIFVFKFNWLQWLFHHLCCITNPFTLTIQLNPPNIIVRTIAMLPGCNDVQHQWRCTRPSLIFFVALWTVLTNLIQDPAQNINLSYFAMAFSGLVMASARTFAWTRASMCMVPMCVRGWLRFRVLPDWAALRYARKLQWLAPCPALLSRPPLWRTDCQSIQTVNGVLSLIQNDFFLLGSKT